MPHSNTFLVSIMYKKGFQIPLLCRCGSTQKEGMKLFTYVIPFIHPPHWEREWLVTLDTVCMAALAFPRKPETFPPQWLYRETKHSAFCPQAQVPPANSISVSHREGVPLSWQEVGAHGFLCHALYMAPKGCSHTDEQELAAVHDLGVWCTEPTLL